MLRKTSFCFALILMCGAAVTSYAADSPWNGTWKLDQAKSKMTGTTFSITESNGMYTEVSGAFTFKFACDGKEYPTIADRTVICTKDGNNFDTVSKANGKELAKTHHELSADGKQMMTTTTGTRPDGSSFTDKDTMMREGGGSGMVGKWKNVKTDSSAPASIAIKVSGDMFRYENPEYKAVSETKLDGTPGDVTGPTVPKGVTYSSKAMGANKVAGKVSLNGKVISEEVMTISADGKTMTDVSWSSEKPNEKQTFVYMKQ